MGKSAGDDGIVGNFNDTTTQEAMDGRNSSSSPALNLNCIKSLTTPGDNDIDWATQEGKLISSPDEQGQIH